MHGHDHVVWPSRYPRVQLGNTIGKTAEGWKIVVATLHDPHAIFRLA